MLARRIHDVTMTQVRSSRCGAAVGVAIQVGDGDGGERQQETVRTTGHLTSLAAMTKTTSFSNHDSLRRR